MNNEANHKPDPQRADSAENRPATASANPSCGPSPVIRLHWGCSVLQSRTVQGICDLSSSADLGLGGGHRWLGGIGHRLFRVFRVVGIDRFLEGWVWDGG
jgi:hypothetical protein